MSSQTATKIEAAPSGFGWAAPLFVALWSTGFIGAKYGLPHADAFSFLLVRFIVAAGLLAAAALVLRAPWPRSWGQAGHIAVAGLLVHATYLGGVFFAIGHGLSAGITALLVGLQPALTAVLVGPILGERVSRRQMLGFALGFMGVALVVAGRPAVIPGGITTDALDPAALAAALIALVGISLGTVYQKRFCADMNLVTGTSLQYAVGMPVMALALWLQGGGRLDWTGEFVFALAWLVLVLSVGAVLLLFLLIRRGAASRVAGLFYLVPPVTALFAWALFGEQLGLPGYAGMALTAAGVLLVTRKP